MPPLIVDEEISKRVGHGGTEYLADLDLVNAILEDYQPPCNVYESARSLRWGDLCGAVDLRGQAGPGAGYRGQKRRRQAVWTATYCTPELGRAIMTRREFLARSGRATAGLAGLSLAAQLTPGRVQAAPEVHLTVWWWGEQEAPGLQQWMRETVHRYRAAHPGVEIATVLQATESLYPSFASAGQARQGPDIQYMWGGISTMQFVWRGYVHPISDLLSEDDLEPVFPGSLRETAFQGKVYGLPWYALPFLLV